MESTAILAKLEMFSKSLRSKIDALGWTPSKLARAAKISPTTVGKILSEERGGELKTILAMSEALKVPVSELLGEVPAEPLPECIIPVVGIAGASAVCLGHAACLDEMVDLTGCHAFRIHDTSMEPLIRQGERAIVRDALVASGDVVIAELDEGEGLGYVCKQFIETPEGIQLRSLNMREPFPTITRKQRPRMWRVVGVTL